MMNKNKWTGFVVVMVACLLMACFAHADVKVTSVEVKPRYPWNGLVDIVYSVNWNEVDLNGEPFEVRVEFEGYDTVLDKTFVMKSMSGDGVNAPITRDPDKTGGTYKATWNAAKDYPTINSSAFQVKIHASIPLYMVVDLSGGPSAEKYPVRYTGEAPDLTKDTCRTTELWLRRIPAGKFLMGSPEEEVGHQEDEVLHEVTLTKSYYIGVFECTQKQYALICGAYNYYAWYKDGGGSSSVGGLDGYGKGDVFPVGYLSWDTIRGQFDTWPAQGHVVSSNSFMGILQKKTGLVFDLPTEAEWEYACRATTTEAFNSSGNFGRMNVSFLNTSGTTVKVGSFQPNIWGLYDMHGNVLEWCLDRYGNYDTMSTIDPRGSSSGNNSVIRGGHFQSNNTNCRSAKRFYTTHSSVLTPGIGAYMSRYNATMKPDGGGYGDLNVTLYVGVTGFRVAAHP